MMQTVLLSWTHTYVIHTLRFPVYDADAYAPAHYLLPARHQTLWSNGTEVASHSTAPAPGSAGRWRLKDDLSGLEGMAAMMYRIQLMYNAYTLYYLLQGFVLVGIMIRLIMYISFQKRLSVIGGTLVSLTKVSHRGAEAMDG